ncbi:MAG: carboxypeptidase-like regulatory domain-containing protein [Cyclobacteriaceae bacterium]|nr:carboxypeptidase-like regulatory domain-containing protein [Cyclobacteriaceae bacterium]
MRYLIFLFSIICPGAAIAQDITISGKVTDAETKEPLPFASVWLKGETIGTVTNAQGDFDFHIPASLSQKTLVISMLGYRSFESTVSAIHTNEPLLVALESSSQLLNEVIVRDSLTGGDILQRALARIEQNYPMEPFLMEGFYRDIKKVGGTYISLLEAAVEIYDENYKRPRNQHKLREGVRLLEVRKSLGYENKFTSFFDQDNLLEDLLLHNTIRYRQIEDRAEMYAVMKRDRDSYFNGNEIFVISYTGEYSLKIFVEKSDYSIIHLEFEITGSDEIPGRKKNMASRFTGIKKTIDFKRIEGKMYLNYISVTSKVDWYDPKTNEVKFNTELFQQLLINQVNPHTDDQISSVEKMSNYGLQYQQGSYNKKFWSKYNVIKDTPLDQKIVQDLEREGPLDKQFEKN